MLFRSVQIFGSTTSVISTILTSLMFGLAIGGYIFGKYADRYKNSLTVYGILEIIIGCYGLLVPIIFSFLPPLNQQVWEGFHHSFYSFGLIRFFLITIVLIIPAILIGGTLPLLSRYFIWQENVAGFTVGTLYMLNIFGAVLGTFMAGFVLLPWLGITNTIYITSSTNILLGLVVVILFLSHKNLLALKGWGRREGLTDKIIYQEIPSMAALFIVFATFAISGFTAIVYAIAWTRGLLLILGPSVYALNIILIILLIGLASGSLIFSRFVDRLRYKVFGLGIIQVIIGCLSIISLFLFHYLPNLFLIMFPMLSKSYYLLLWGKFILASLIIFLPTFFIGGAFPLMISIYAADIYRIGSSVGKGYSLNILGGLVGSFVGAFFLIPYLGINNTIIFAVTINLILGGMILMSSAYPRTIYKIAFLILITVMIYGEIIEKPAWDVRQMSTGVFKHANSIIFGDVTNGRLTSERTKILFYKEGINTTVTVMQERDNIFLKVNGKTDVSSKRDMPTHLLSGHLPLLFGKKVERVMIIGLAAGITVGAVERYPVKDIKVIELEPAIIEASHLFDHVNYQPLNDPRVEVIINDGRNYLEVTPESFDVIISKLSNPWTTGASNLFTREFFKLVSKRLNKDGIFCQWIQLDGMILSDLKSLLDRKSTRLNSSHIPLSRMPSSA